MGKTNPKHQKKRKQIGKKQILPFNSQNFFDKNYQSKNQDKKNSKRLFQSKKKYNSQDRPLSLNNLLRKEKSDIMFYDGGENADSFIIKTNTEDGLNMCPLCKVHERSEKSHIIPKFFEKDIIKRSESGFLRNSDGKRGSFPTHVLLCKNCEQLFSRYESYFASNFYHKIRNEKLPTISESDKLKMRDLIKNKQVSEYLKILRNYGLGDISYNDNLLKFIISISWRILILELIHAKFNAENIPQYLEAIEKNWRDYLTGNTQVLLKKHYLILTTLIADNEISDEFMDWKSRSKDLWDLISQKSVAMGFSSDKNEFIYCNIPCFLIISTLKYEELKGYEKTAISENGIYPLHQEIIVNSFNYLSFLIENYSKIPPLDSSSIEKIKNSIKKRSK